jgi:hypothetical protein
VGCYGGQERFTQGFGEGNHTKRDHMEDLSTNGRIISRWLLKNWDGETWTGLIWLRIGTGVGR